MKNNPDRKRIPYDAVDYVKAHWPPSLVTLVETPDEDSDSLTVIIKNGDVIEADYAEFINQYWIMLRDGMQVYEVRVSEIQRVSFPWDDEDDDD